MPTYHNPRTRVVHWIYKPGECWPTTTACGFLNNQMGSWKRENVDRVGELADVTCLRCEETEVFLDACRQETDAHERAALNSVID